LSSLTKVLFELVERLSNLMLSLTRNEVSSWGSSKFEHSLGLIRAWARRRGGCHVVLGSNQCRTNAQALTA
jgi:hypothetical protein